MGVHIGLIWEPR